MRIDESPWVDDRVELAAVEVPAGNYLVAAKLVVNRGQSEGPLAGSCLLSTGDRVDFDHVNRGKKVVDDAHVWPVMLHDTVTFDAATTISLVGENREPGAGWRSQNIILTALRVGAVNPSVSSRPRPSERSTPAAAGPDGGPAWKDTQEEIKGLRTDLRTVIEALAMIVGEDAAPRGKHAGPPAQE